MYQTYYGSDDLLLALGRELSPWSWPGPWLFFWLTSFIWAPPTLWALQWHNRRWSVALAVLVLFFPGITYTYALFDLDLSGWGVFNSWFDFWYNALRMATPCFVFFWFCIGIGLILWVANVVVARKTGHQRSLRSTRYLLAFSACLLLLTAAPTYYLATYKTLEDAVKEGNLELTEKRLRSNLLGLDANTGEVIGISWGGPAKVPLLPFALRRNNVEMVRLLLENGAVVDQINVWGADNPMAVACGQSTIEIVEMLLDYWGDPNEGVHAAARDGRLDVLQLLISRGANVQTMDKNGRTLLDTAAVAGAEDIVEFLSRFDLEYTDYRGLLCRDQLDRFRIVIESGTASKLWNSDEGGFRQELLREATRCGSIRVFDYLLDAGVKPEPLDDGSTLLHLAAENGRTAVAQRLLQLGIDPNALDETGRTPLCRVRYFRPNDVVRILLENGANPNLGRRTKPLTSAVMERNAEAVRLLIEHGAKVDGDPKHPAVFKSLFEQHNSTRGDPILDIAMILVAHGADPLEPVTTDGKNAIERAEELDYPELAAYLRTHVRDAG